MKTAARWKPLANVPRTLYGGPAFRLSKVGADSAAYYHPQDGVTFFFEVHRRQTSEYTLSEMKALHRALGTQIAKIESTPLPTGTRN